MDSNIINVARNILPALVFILSSFNHSLLSNQDDREWTDFIDQQMQDLMNRYDLPNAAVAVVHDGRIVLTEGYGYSDVETLTPVDPLNHLFRTGSVSKIFTWTAVMQLVEQGLIDLDRDVNSYIDFSLPEKVLDKNRNDKVIPVTMRHLLSNTAGFEDVAEGLFRIRIEDHISLRDYLVKYMPARIFPAGSVMAYSNYGTALAGYVVERVSGLPFGEYMEKNIFSPLGMNNSSFRQPLHIDLHEKLVGAYRKVDGEFIKGGFEYMPAPAGGLSTTAEDMALYMLVHLKEGYDGNRSIDSGSEGDPEYEDVPVDVYKGEVLSGSYDKSVGKILDRETIRMMHSTLFTHHPLLGGMTYGFKEYMANGIKVVFHAGSSTLFDSGLYLLPDSGTGIFFCYSGGTYTGHIEVFNAFLQRFFADGDGEKPLDSIPGSGTIYTIDKLKGEYQPSRRTETRPEKLLNLLSGVLRLRLVEKEDIDAEVDLLISRSAEELIRENKEKGIAIDLFGSRYRLEELQPGILKNLDAPADYPFGPIQYLVAGTDPFGRLMLSTDGPMTFIRMPFYETSLFTAVVAGFSLLLILITFIYNIVKGSVGLFHRKVCSFRDYGGTAGHLIVIHSSLTVVMLFAAAVTGRPDPVYQLPMSALGHTSYLTRLLEILPTILSLLAVTIFLFCAFAWMKKWWKVTGRIHYSLYAISAVAIAWLFKFYNLTVF